MWMTALTRLRARALCHPGPAWHAHPQGEGGAGPPGASRWRQCPPASARGHLPCPCWFHNPAQGSLNWAPDAGGAGKPEPGLTLTHFSCADIFLGGARPNLAEKGVEATGERGPA